MANLSGGAEAHARFKQYEYRANSSLVLTTDSRPRDTHEPTGELETLWGRIDRRNFGERAVQARPSDLLHAALLALSFFLAGALNNGNCLDDDDKEEYEEPGGGNHFLGFMFGNVDDAGDLDADYLHENKSVVQHRVTLLN